MQQDKPFEIAGKTYSSRLLVGTGKYQDLDETAAAIEGSGAEIVTVSDATIAMELGCDAVLMNTAIAHAGNPVLMASAMRKAIEAGREAYLAGRMPKRQYAPASSPLDGTFFQ